MKIERAKKEEVVVAKSVISTLEGGTVFKVGTKLFLKTADDGYGGANAVRLTTGEVEEFSSDDLADEVVEGTFNYA